MTGKMTKQKKKRTKTEKKTKNDETVFRKKKV